MPVGYPGDWVRTGDFPGQAGQAHVAYVPIKGWLASGYNGSDMFLYEKPPVPAAPGDPGPWPRVQSAAGGDATLDTRSSAFCQLAPHGFDELHVFANHGSTRRYKLGVFDPSGEITWIVGSETNGISCPAEGAQSRNQFVVDGAGRPWVFWTNSGGARCIAREDGSWTARQHIEDFSYSDFHGDIFVYIHTDGTPGVGVVYNRAANTLAFRYRFDSDPVTDPWRFGWDEPIGFTLDDHTCVMAGVLPGDTGSTIFGATKRLSSGNTVDAFRAAPGQGLDPNHPQCGSGTRPMAGMDITNGVGRLSAQLASSQPLRGYDFDLTQPMPATAPAPIILCDDDNASTNGNGNDGPAHPVNDTTGWMHRGDMGSGSGYWWNEQAIAGGEPTLAVDGASHAHTAANVALAFDALFVPDELRHAHRAAEVPLDVAFVGIDFSLHKHTAANVDLVQATSLVLEELRHAHRAANVELAEGAILELAGLAHPHTAEEIVFVPADVLMVAGLRHVHRAAIVDLVQDGFLEIADFTLHKHVAANVDLVLDLALDVAPSRHKHVAESLILDTSTPLVLEGLRHAHTAELVDLVQAGTLVVEGARHVHRAANVVIIDDQGKPVIDPSARVYVAADASRVYIARDPIARIN